MCSVGRMNSATVALGHRDLAQPPLAPPSPRRRPPPPTGGDRGGRYPSHRAHRRPPRVVPDRRRSDHHLVPSPVLHRCRRGASARTTDRGAETPARSQSAPPWTDDDGVWLFTDWLDLPLDSTDVAAVAAVAAVELQASMQDPTVSSTGSSIWSAALGPHTPDRTGVAARPTALPGRPPRVVAYRKPNLLRGADVDIESSASARAAGSTRRELVLVDPCRWHRIPGTRRCGSRR